MRAESCQLRTAAAACALAARSASVSGILGRTWCTAAVCRCVPYRSLVSPCPQQLRHAPISNVVYYNGVRKQPTERNENLATRLICLAVKYLDGLVNVVNSNMINFRCLQVSIATVLHTTMFVCTLLSSQH